MGNFSGILILSDLDGTLFNSDCKVSEKNAKKIEYFKQNGGLFGIASGRHPDNIRRYFDSFTPNAPCICYNGGMIYDFSVKKFLMSKCLPESVIGIAKKLDTLFPESCIAVETLETMNLVKQNDVSKVLLEIVECEPKYFESFEKMTDPWIKLSVWTTPKQSHEVAAKLSEMGLPDGMRFVRTHACAVEILSHDTDKGYALNDYRGLVTGVKKIIALGDNENDNIMLQKADVSIVPSNVNPATARFATRKLCVSCDEDFVKAAIELVEKEYCFSE